MISKLRKKIIAINVISVCIVFFVAEILMFAIGFNRVNTERDARINAALDFDYTLDPNFSDNKIFKDFALVVYDVQNNKVVYCAIGEESKITREKLDAELDRIVSAKDNEGWLHVWKMQYAKRTEGDLVKIVISHNILRNNSSTPYIIISGGMLLLGIVCYLIISMMLASIALKPIEESWVQQKQFVADASHELKTPLSVIMANTEIVASHKDETVESQMKWIENTREEAERMAGLVADLLFLAKDDDGLKVQMEAVNMSDCVETAALSYDAVFYENNKDFSYEIAPNVKVMGNGGQLKQLVTILLDNSNKYSIGRGNIKLMLISTNKKIELTVSNDSYELTDENLAHLFDRFYTVDKSRNEGGNGLGLSIAKTICLNHGGNLSVEYEEGRTAFTAEFPVYKQKKEVN